MKSYSLSLRARRSPRACGTTFIGRLYRRSCGSSHQPSAELIRWAGREVTGRGCLSARHHNRESRNAPRGVPPSPSRLFALMPPRPNATGNTSVPAVSQPRRESPGLRRTVIRDKDRFRKFDVILAFAWVALNTSSRLLFYPRMLYFATISMYARTPLNGAPWGDGQ
jgi:hypothetical protein